MAAFTVPYRNGMQLAHEEINAKGGVLGGRKLEIVFRDDGATTGDAVRVAEELVTRENVSFLVGTFLSNVGLAVADYANQKKMLFLATEPLTDAITMAQGNRYTFRVRPSTYMQTKMLVEAVKGRASAGRSWRRTTSTASRRRPNFKRLIKEANPRRRDRRRAVSGARQDRGRRHGRRARTGKPDGIFNVLFGADLPPFVREGNTRGLFEKRTVASLLTGEPEYLLPLGEETPEGWIITGYPWEQITGPEAQGLRRRLPREVQRHAAARLAARLRRRLHDPRPDRQGRLHRHRQAHHGARGHALRDHHRPRDDARHRPPVHAGRLGRRDDAQGQDGHHEELELRGRRRIHVPGGRGEGGAQGRLRQVSPPGPLAGAREDYGARGR